MSRGVKLDRADWTLVQYASGAPDSDTKGNIYINSNNGTLYTRRNETASWSAISGSGASDHGTLTGLSDDDHAQYPLLLGRIGGQILRGGTASGNDLTLISTSNATKGYVFFGAETNAYFEDIGKLNITIPNTGNSSCAEFQQDDTTNGGAAVIIGNDYDTGADGSNSDGWAINLNGSNPDGNIIGSASNVILFSPESGVYGYSTSSIGNVGIVGHSTASTSAVIISTQSAVDDSTISLTSYSDGGISYISLGASDLGSATARKIMIGTDLGTDATKDRVRIYSGGGKYVAAADQVNKWRSYTPLFLEVSELRLWDDNHTGSGWTQQYMTLSDATSEWNTFETNFGEVSILNAINQAKGAGGATVLNDLTDVSTGGATQDQVLAYNSSSGVWSPATVSASGGVTLDGAYDYGGAGSGRSIDVDSGAVALTVSDTDNNAALVVTQNDSTNDPDGVQISNAGSGYALKITQDGSSTSGIYLTTTGSTAQKIYSDQQLTVGTSAQRSSIDGSFGGLILENLPTTGMSYIEINATSADDTGMISITADGSTGSQNGIIEIEALGADTSGDTYIKILSDNHAGTEESYVIIDADGAGTNSVRIGTSTYGSLDEIRFYDVGNDGSSWTQSYVLLTDGSNTEWNNFETNFGEVSIFNALNQLSGAVGGSLALNDLSDVSTGGATQDQVIAYNASSGTWSPATISGSGGGWTTSENTDVDTGTENVDTFDPDGDGAVLWYYSVQNGANHRAGTVTACWDDSAGTASYNDVSTSDIGDTSPLSLAVDMTGGSGTVRLRATATTDNWIVKVARAEIL